MTPSETETLKMFDEKNVKAGDIHVRLSNAITHAQLAMGEDEMRDTRTEVFDAVKEILLTQIRLARANERKQAYEDGKKHECCDGECNHDDCCGKIPENCTHKESPVSQSVEEREAELKKLYEETNIKALIEEMEKDAEEYGQYHDDDCPLNREGGSDFGDVCECEKIRAMKTLAREWMGKVNRMWVVNVQNHRKHCSPRGNKELTKIKDKINGSELSRTTLSTLVKEMEGLKKEGDKRIPSHSRTQEKRRHFNAGISAAVEVVKKMGV